MKMEKKDIYRYFEEMILLKDHQRVWDFHKLDFSALTSEEQTNLYIKLFDEDWHSDHENIALHFQHTRDPLATDTLFKTATRNFYKDFDHLPLSRKCTWALADIGTEKAKQYLVQLTSCGDLEIEGYAKKRLAYWEAEAGRKGQRIRHKDDYNIFIRLENYVDSLDKSPKTGQQIIGHTFELTKNIYKSGKGTVKKLLEEYVVVYQAYKPSIAQFAVENQCLGGPDFSFNRMSWIKPNFLWMMYRCGGQRKKIKNGYWPFGSPKKISKTY
jgi:hypothetical protein